MQSLLHVFGPDGQSLYRYGAAKNGFELLGIVGFCEVGERAFGQGADRVFRRGVPSQNDDREGRVQLHHHLEDRKSVQIRQLNIEQRCSVLFLLCIAQCLIAGSGALDRISFMRQHVAERFTDIGIVVNNEDRCLHRVTSVFRVEGCGNEWAQYPCRSLVPEALGMQRTTH